MLAPAALLLKRHELEVTATDMQHGKCTEVLTSRITRKH